MTRKSYYHYNSIFPNCRNKKVIFSHWKWWKIMTMFIIDEILKWRIMIDEIFNKYFSVLFVGYFLPPASFIRRMLFNVQLFASWSIHLLHHVVHDGEETKQEVKSQQIREIKSKVCLVRKGYWKSFWFFKERNVA